MIRTMMDNLAPEESIHLEHSEDSQSHPTQSEDVLIFIKKKIILFIFFQHSEDSRSHPTQSGDFCKKIVFPNLSLKFYFLV